MSGRWATANGKLNRQTINQTIGFSMGHPSGIPAVAATNN